MKKIFLVQGFAAFLFFCVILATTTSAQTVFIPASAIWKYLDNGTNQGTAWRAVSFNDNSWSSGAAELGFDDSPVTILDDTKIGYYFRKSVNIPNPALFTNFTMKLRRDDGAVVYVNGIEVYRNNMPSGTIAYNTPASSTCTDDGKTVLQATIDVSKFIAGNNVVAVEIHNRKLSSSDLTFELLLIANGNVAPACAVPNVYSFGSRNVTGNSANVFWDPIAGAVSYNVSYRIRNSGNSFSTPINTANSTLVISGLSGSTDYEFMVQTVCPGSVLSAFSSVGWFTTGAGTTVCSTPDVASFGTRNISATSAEVFWNSTAGASAYNLQYRIRNSGSTYSASISTSSASFVLTGLQASMSYEYIVQAVCGAGLISPFSASSWFTTGTVSSTCPVTNVNLFGTRNRTATTAEVFWVAVTGATSYNVAFRIRNSGSAYSAYINASSVSLVLTGLIASTNYEFIIQSVCSGSSLSAASVSGWFTTSASGGGGTTTLIRGPYLTVATSNSIAVQWRTGSSSNNEVRYGISPTALVNTATNSTVSTEHSVQLTGLVANTKYYYSIGEIGSVLQGDANNYFVTAPANGSSQALKFWVTGDFGNGSSGQTAVRNSFSAYTAGQTVNGWLWLGDNAYANGTDAEYQAYVFNVYPTIFKNLPVFPAPGNHDYAQAGYLSSASRGTNFPYFSIFNIPTNSGTEKYYSTNYGNVHFIALDSYGSYNTAGSPMYNWLQNDLASNTQQWTVVYFHHPPFSKGSHDSDNSDEMVDMRTNIIPLLESYGVDLVLGGHSHSYERSNFIKNHTGSESSFNSSIYPSGHIVQAGAGPYSKSSRTGNGTIYVVCGVSGQSSTSTTSGYPHNAMNRSIVSSYGSLILDVNGGALTCKFLTSAGAIADQFTMNKPNNVARFSSTESSPLTNSVLVPVVYPNPSMGDFTISLNNDEAVQLQVSIYNISGSKMFEETYTKQKDEDIHIGKSESNLSAGIYMVNILHDRINTTVRFVVY